MTQDPQKTPLSELPQVFDSSLKNWITQQAAAILPLLLPGTVYQQSLDVEMILPTMRVDKVFKVSYDGEEYLLDVEFEAGYDNRLKSRLLIYNAILYHKHQLPVITIVVYPFSTTVAQSPLCVVYRNEPILTFVFQTISLFELNAQEVVQQHQDCLYPLLPTMNHVDADLLQQAMRELVKIYRDDLRTLEERFAWIELFLARTTTIPLEKKEQIKKMMDNMMDIYRELLKTSPRLQKLRDESLMQGRQEGEVLAFRRMLVNRIRAKYPDLAAFAQEQAGHFDNPDTLELLIEQVMSASSARAVRKLLKSGPKS